jgi:hypothetical protein
VLFNVKPTAFLILNFRALAVGTVVDTDPGTVVDMDSGIVGATTPGIVVDTASGTVRTHLFPALGTYETAELLTPKPFRFLARAETFTVLPTETFFTVHRVADLRALQVALPIFTSVSVSGAFAFVVALTKTTVTSTFPLLRLFTAVIPEIVGLVGFAVTEEADAVDVAEMHNNPPTVKLEMILEIFNRNLP